MKKRLLFVFTLAVFCTSAIRAQMTFPSADSVINYLSGAWKWHNSCGGITGTFCQTPSNLGYSQTLIFSRITGVTDSIAYKYYKNATLTESSGAKISYTTMPSFGTNWTLYFKKMGWGAVIIASEKRRFHFTERSFFLTVTCTIFTVI